MRRATILFTIRWTLGAVLIAASVLFMVRGAAQASLDGVPAFATQWFSWRALFHLGASAAALSAAAAALLLLRWPTSRGRVAFGVLLVFLAPLCWVTPLVGHFVQVDPCLNLGKTPMGQTDACSRP
jgi:hypothetical protein